MDLGEFKPFIDQEMLTILGQMDAPTEIFDHVYLGSEWNASNLEELQKNGLVFLLLLDNYFYFVTLFSVGLQNHCNLVIFIFNLFIVSEFKTQGIKNIFYS